MTADAPMAVEEAKRWSAYGVAAVEHGTELVASERPVTIAEIISVFKRIARRAPKVISSQTNRSALYSRRVQFRSHVIPARDRAPATSLLVGIGRVMSAERDFFARNGPCALRVS